MIQGLRDTKEPTSKALTQGFTNSHFEPSRRKLVFMKDAKIFVEVDGKTDILEDYVLVYPSGPNTSVALKADVFLLGKATGIIYTQFLRECAKYSDQDLYEVCKATDLSFDVIQPLVREVRNNG